eukprot:CAMPEP_0118676554 /NCGR_PEP_ID=MMETSP0800-20121206/2115_1 /TAXON_ID=210618 ORGANISM="Striatella unipunctata, Strain CCMP2910" /NCGR_SAMPLE_ID=MMETSP0800 /ASSEMBLY_ACC=CAM_ASM_000638 /LENGTH=281 /DNA_ID=CAMNT_0006572087 /DNA_START=128 /DNA_END=973 /DNA_ORIENTATION=-
MVDRNKNALNSYLPIKMKHIVSAATRSLADEITVATKSTVDTSYASSALDSSYASTTLASLKTVDSASSFFATLPNYSHEEAKRGKILIPGINCRALCLGNTKPKQRKVSSASSVPSTLERTGGFDARRPNVPISPRYSKRNLLQYSKSYRDIRRDASKKPSLRRMKSHTVRRKASESHKNYEHDDIELLETKAMDTILDCTQDRQPSRTSSYRQEIDMLLAENEFLSHVHMQQRRQYTPLPNKLILSPNSAPKKLSSRLTLVKSNKNMKSDSVKKSTAKR